MTGLIRVLLEARSVLGELNGFSFAVPNPFLLLTPPSSGNLWKAHGSRTSPPRRTSPPELPLSEKERRAPDKEVLRYRDAIMWGWEQLSALRSGTASSAAFSRSSCRPTAASTAKGERYTEQLTGAVIYTPPPAHRDRPAHGRGGNASRIKPERRSILGQACLLITSSRPSIPSRREREDGTHPPRVEPGPGWLLKLPILYLSASSTGTARGTTSFLPRLRSGTHGWSGSFSCLGESWSRGGSARRPSSGSRAFTTSKGTHQALPGRSAPSTSRSSSSSTHPLAGEPGAVARHPLHPASRYLKSLTEAGILELSSTGCTNSTCTGIIEVING
jgi:hypothetical protein